MKAHTTRLQSKKVACRDFKNLNKKEYPADVKLKNISRKNNDSHKNYELLSYQFQSVVNRHTPLKTKII